MRVLILPAATLCLAASLSVFTAAPASAAAETQPPMNSFNYAFYACDGGAFQISYNSDKPTEASLTVNTDNKTYELKRAQQGAGVTFEGGGARFWTDGKAVTVSGTAATLKNCKMKG